MTTETACPPSVTWIRFTARCKWCDKPQHFSVRGSAGTEITFRCNDRGCRMEQQHIM